MRFDEEGYVVKDHAQTIINILVVLALIGLIVGYAFRGSCVDDADTKQAVEKQGYADVKLYGKTIFFVGFSGCDSNDAAKYGAKAKNAQGKEVDLIVCSGWPFKGITVRSE